MSLDLTSAPYWNATTVQGESLLFVREGDAPPASRLLFPPRAVRSLTSADGMVAYEEGRDYAVDAAAGVIRLPAGSRIPFKTMDELHPLPVAGPRDVTRQIESCTDGVHNLLFGEGCFFHGLQCAVTYDHDARWRGPVPQFAGARLPRTVEALAAGRPLKVTLHGDSISHGANASALSNVPPHQPSYGPLVAANLERVYGAPIAFQNHAVGGWSARNGLREVALAAADRADLVILAFGMNDAGSFPVDQYLANTVGMMDGIRKERDDTEFILVASMTGNPEWSYLKQERFPAFRDGLAGLCGPGVVLANLTSVWTELLTRKRFVDLTGNGVNHPNDFGHRIYAQTLLGLLVPGMTS